MIFSVFVRLSAEKKRGLIAAVTMPVGSKPGDGHNGLYLATSQWEPDVFRFLAQALAR